MHVETQRKELYEFEIARIKRQIWDYEQEGKDTSELYRELYHLERKLKED